MANASPSGKGAPGLHLTQLAPELMCQIRTLVRQQAHVLSDAKFEGLWQKCVQSISKACQNLRYGRLAKKWSEYYSDGHGWT